MNQTNISSTRYSHRPLNRRKLLLFTAVMFCLLVIVIELILHGMCALIPSVDTVLGTIPRVIPDSRLGHRPNPQFDGHDARGFRNVRALQHAEVVCLGDSQTYGAGVSSHEAWPHQLSQLTGINVYSMAFGGYGPTHSLVLLEQALALKPKVVIEAFYSGNDLWDCYNMVYERGQLPELMSKDSKAAAGIEEAERQGPLLAKITKFGRAKAGNFRLNAPARAFGLRKFLSNHSKICAIGRAIKRRVKSSPPSESRQWDMLQKKAAASNGLWEPIESSKFLTIGVPQYRLCALDMEDPRIQEGHRIAIEAISRMGQKLDASGSHFVVLLIPTKLLVFESQFDPHAKSVSVRQIHTCQVV